MTNNKERVVYQTMVALSKKDTDITKKCNKIGKVGYSSYGKV